MAVIVIAIFEYLEKLQYMGVGLPQHCMLK